MINTKEENELLKAFEAIENVIEAKRNNDDMRLTIDIQHDIENVLAQVKVTYPTVKYPISLINGGCGSCFSNFLGDMIPVYDRLKKQQNNELEGLNNQLVVDSVNATDDNVDAVIEKYNEDLDKFNSQISEKLDNVIEGMNAESEPIIGSVEYNRKNVNEVNPFNPIGSDDVEEPIAPSKRGRKGKNK